MPPRDHLLKSKPLEQRYHQCFDGGQGQIFPYAITWTHREGAKRMGRRCPTSGGIFPAPNVEFLGIVAPKLTGPVDGVGADQNSLAPRDSDAADGSVFDCGACHHGHRWVEAENLHEEGMEVFHRVESLQTWDRAILAYCLL